MGCKGKDRHYGRMGEMGFCFGVNYIDCYGKF